jgi:hypothetical protein
LTAAVKARREFVGCGWQSGVSAVVRALLCAAVMKMFVGLGLVVGITAVADADPVPALATDQVENYIEAGAIGGFAQGASFFGPMVEGGHWLGSGPWWLHVLVTAGQASEIDEGGSGSFEQGRIGIEARGCTVQYICGSVGADLAVSHVKYGTDDGYDDMEDTVALAVLPRASVDLGTKHVRLRASFEFGVGTEGYEIGVSAGLVALW